MGEQQSRDASILLMSADRLNRSVDRMAHQIAEDHGNTFDILFIGLKERGLAIAEKLATHVKSLSSKEVKVIDLPEASDEESGFNINALRNIQNKYGYVIVVDDVIFSGRTMLTAIQEIYQHIDAEVLRTAALVDRGHRKVPIELTFAGLKSPTKLDEHVQVRMNEGRTQDVILTKPVN